MAGSVTPDVQGDTEKEINAILPKYPKGKIDAIWSAWDAFGRGASRHYGKTSAPKSSYTALTFLTGICS